MSAIFGILNTQKAPIERTWLESMRQSLAHRGPDGSGIFHQEAIGLGHLLLRVTPESQYEQSPCRIEGLVVTAQSRLDERETLMNKLRIAPERRPRITDPEMIGLGYRQWGERCVEHFLGDFAFAIWDEQEQQLFCAKDHLGIRPFLYAYQNGLFVFATELQALVLTRLFPTQIDHSHIRDLIVDLYDQPDHSGWTNIKLLRGGHYLVLKNQQVQLTRYWKPEPQATLWCKDPAEYGQMLRTLLEQAVADRMRTEAEVGLTLSGGLDSSSIACIAAPQLRARGRLLHTASSVLSPDWPHPDEDEMVYIQRVLDQETNIRPNFVYSGEHSFLGGIEQKFDQHMAIFDLWHYIDSALYAKLQGQNVRRELSGYFGDMTVSLHGIYPLAHLFRKGQLARFWKMLKQRQASNNYNYYALLKTELVLPMLPFGVMKRWYQIKKRPYPWSIDELPFSMSNPEKQELLQRLEAYHQKQGFFDYKNLQDNIWNQDIEFEAPELDCNAARVGIESTFPFLDKRIIDFLFQLPVEAFFEQGLSRGLIRMATKNCLPTLINQRQSKGNFSPGFYYILKKSLPTILKWIELGHKQHGYSSFVDIEKIIYMVRSLEMSTNSANFDTKFWSTLKICMWIALSQWETSGSKS